MRKCCGVSLLENQPGKAPTPIDGCDDSDPLCRNGDSHFTVSGCEGNARSLALRPHKQPPLTHAVALAQPRQAPQSALNAGALAPFSLSAPPVRGLGFRREGPRGSAPRQQVPRTSRGPYRPARSHCVQTRLCSLPNRLLLPNLLSLGL